MTLMRSEFNFASLSHQERLRLAHDLLESVLDAGELTPAQLAEMERRDDAAERGVSPCLSWESVKQELRAAAP